MKKRQLALAILCGIMAGFVAIFFLWWSALYLEKGYAQKDSKRILDLSGDIMRERNAVFETLSNVQLEGCSDELLSVLRSNLILNRHVGDIVVFSPRQNVILCSAVSGVLKQPLAIRELPTPGSKYPTRKTWFQIPLDFLPKDQNFHLVREGNFGLVLFPANIQDLAREMRWALLTVDGEGKAAETIYGDSGLYSEFESNRQMPFVSSVVVKSCAYDAGYVCAITKRTFQDIWLRNRFAGAIGMVLSLFIVLAVTLASMNRLKARSSPKGRVLRTLASGSYQNFSCVYQPIIDLQTGQMVGCEVLARYQDEQGPLSPNIFVPIVDAAGATWKFTEIIIANTVREISPLECAPGFRVSLNFYPKDLESEHIERLKGCEGFRLLKERGFQLVCEILETGIGDTGAIETTVAYLKRFGFKIAIDDFGTGTSNLKQLKDIRPDYLKIDKSFVDDIGENDASIRGCMIPHILGIAKEIDTLVIVEGIETETQAHVLKALGADFGQGYFFAKPMDIDGLRTMISNAHNGCDFKEPVIDTATG